MRTAIPRPSLNALRAFEATARLGSMSAAADELFVTHGAVSRHIRSLEDQLGVILLDRGSGGTVPTADGLRLAEGLASAFRLIQASVEQLKPAPLTLSCSASVMMYWLLPRIGGFHQAHPGVELQFNVNYGHVDFVWENVSVAIRLSSIKPPEGAHIRELTAEWIGPVCSPEFAKSARLDSVAKLAGAPLLATKTRPEAWDDWAKAFGYSGARLSSSGQYEHFFLLIQAASCNLGVAVVPKMLVLEDLRSGKLIAPFGFVPSARKLVLWIAPHLDGRSDVEALAGWLVEQMRSPELTDPPALGEHPVVSAKVATRQPVVPAEAGTQRRVIPAKAGIQCRDSNSKDTGSPPARGRRAR
jgi:DNA-binding transcriptional LysR family regulator